MVTSIKPIEFYVKGITLKDALKSGFIDKLVQHLENNGIKVRYVMLVLDPVGEPGLLKIRHISSIEADKGGLHITIDPDMSDRVIRAVEKVFSGGEENHEHS